MASFIKISRPMDEAADPTGKPQTAIMAYLANADGPVEISSMARAPAFRGLHFKAILSAAKALAKKGLVSTDGNTIQKA